MPSRPPRSIVSAALPVTLALLVALASLALLPAAGADSATILQPSIDPPRGGMSAVWDGSSAYVFGGEGPIVRFDPATRTLTNVGPSLGTALSAVWNGTFAFVFGTGGGSLPGDGIDRFDPSTNTLERLETMLPSPRACASAVWTGQDVFLFGGSYAGFLSEIVRYTPATDTITIMGAQLPQALGCTSAVWDGTYAYIFGGQKSGNYYLMAPDILRYDPLNDEVIAMNATLPSGRSATSAFWDGQYAYIVGGQADEHLWLRDIVRYDPSTDSTTLLSARLPRQVSGAGVAWTGQDAYLAGGLWISGVLRFTPSTGNVESVTATLLEGDHAQAIASTGSEAYTFGGWSWTCSCLSDQIARFNLTTHRVTEMGATLPSQRMSMSAVWTGTHAFVFGGVERLGSQDYLDEIVRYDPVADEITVMNAKLPTPHARTTAVWDGTYAYIFGGACEGDVCDLEGKEIVRYDPSLDQVTIMLGQLPLARQGGAAVWNGTYAFLFGGAEGLLDCNNQVPPACATTYSGTRNILRYDPALDAVTTMNALVPFDSYYGYEHTAVWDAGHDVAYMVFAGYARVARYDTTSDNATTMDAWLPYGTYGPTAAWDGRSAFVLGACNSCNGWDRIVAYTLEPGPPAVLTANGGEANATLSWAEPSNTSYTAPLTAYRVYRDGALAAEVGVATSFIDAGLEDGTPYAYRVTALNADGEGAPSAQATARTSGAAGAPSAPLNLAVAQGPGAGRLSLSWNAPAQGGDSAISGYKVYRATDPSGRFELLATLGNVHAFADDGLPSGVSRFYLVGAVNAQGAGDLSDVASNTTFSPPARPTMTIAAGPGGGQITLTWTAPGTDGLPVTGFKVYRSQGYSGTYHLIATLGTATGYTDSGLPPDAHRYYRLSALNDAGEGEQSWPYDTTTFALPGAPTGLAAVRGDTQVTLSWTAASASSQAPVTNYTIYRGTTTANGVAVALIGNVTTYTESGLTNGVLYYYNVSAINAAGEGSKSNGANVTPATTPGAPTLTATRGNQQVSLAWTVPGNGGSPITNYTLYRGTASGAASFLVRLADATSYTDAGLTNGVAYYYQVSANNSVGEGARSAETSATPAAVPGAPTGLAASRGDGQAALSWTPPGDAGGNSITNYSVYRATTPGGASFLRTLGNVTSYTDTGLANGVTYYYQVTAHNAVGEGSRSAEANVTPLALPGAPTALSATRGNAQVALSWNAPAATGGSAISNYTLYRGSSSGSETFHQRLGNVTSYTDTSLTNGVTYYYKVSANNTAGEGPLSTEASATPGTAPSAPLSLTVARGPGVGELKLEWQAPSSNGGLAISNYKVYRATASGGTYSVAATLGNVLTYTDTGLPNGATRWYKVSAVNDAGEGAQSSSASNTTFDVPSAPASLSATAGPDAGELKLTWQAPASDGGLAITNYKVYHATSSGGTYNLAATLGNVLTFTDAGLPNGGTRWFKISAVNDAGEGAQTASASATTFDLPAVPSNLAATPGPGVGEIKLTWQAPSTNGGTLIISYNVYRATTSGGTYSLAASLGNVLTFIDAGLANGATRFYKVSAANLVGEGPQSASGSTTTFDLPTEPRNLAASSGPGAGEISLSWQAPSSNGGAPITGYKVYRATSSGGTYSAIASLGSVLSFKDTGLPSSATRYYKVTASNLVGEGTQSTEASATSPAIVPPSAPLSLAATPGPGAGQIKLTWLAPAQDGGAPITGYAVYRADASTGPYIKTTTLGNVLTHTDTGMPNGATRWYKLAASNQAGESAQSSSASARTFDKPSEPRNLDTEATLGFHVTLNHVGLGIHLAWDAPSDDGGTAVTNYKIYWTTDPNQPGQLVATVGNVHDYDHTDADPLKPNYYRITAVNLVGEGPASPRACALTYPWALAPGLAPPGGGCR
jgi:fibronectin type 3 domain-containing protein